MDKWSELTARQTLIKAFKTRKLAKAEAAAHAKANKPARKRTTTSKKLLPLIDDNDIEEDDGRVTRRDEEPTNPLDVSRYTKSTKNKCRMAGPSTLDIDMLARSPMPLSGGGHELQIEQKLNRKEVQSKQELKKAKIVKDTR